MSDISILSATILLFLVMDPFGNLPLFAIVLKNVPQKRRRFVIVRELLIALAILMGFLLAGRHMLDILRISRPALSISGGVILFLISLRMIFPIGNRRFYSGSSSEPLIVPLAIPFIAGPSSMTMLLILVSKYPGRQTDWIIALALAWAAGAVILMMSNILQRILREKGLNVLERLAGMILIVIAIQMFLDGISAFITTVTSNQ